MIGPQVDTKILGGVMNIKQGAHGCAPKNQFRLSHITKLFAVVILATQLAGCCNVPKPDLFDGSLMDRAFGCYRDKVWAKRACNLRYSSCNRPYGAHFQSGFEAGYESICKGGDGYVPATPPECYWGFDYQTPDGAQCVNAWFEGYPAGVAAAKRDRAGTYRDIYVSRMIQSAMAQQEAPTMNPSEVPVVDSNAAVDSEVQPSSYTGSLQDNVIDLSNQYPSPNEFEFK